MYLLSYSARESKIYLADRDVNIYAWSLSLTVIEYQTAILRGDLDTAAEILPTIPTDQRNRIARFLESQDLKDLAMDVTEDVEHRFDLAIQLDKLDVALDIAREVDSDIKWKTVGDVAMASWKLNLAEECLERANDLSSLLLLHTSSGNAKGMRKVADLARKLNHLLNYCQNLLTDHIFITVGKGSNNIAFAALLQLGATEEAIDLLIKTDRIPEAGFGEEWP
jgi:coatomer subunit beta'